MRLTARTDTCWPFAAPGSQTNTACNDNLSSSEAEENEMLLAASLRFFAEHGLAAARKAHENAEANFHDGDRAAFHWWKQICSMLDRRLAMTLNEDVLNRHSL
jgi:hypothetical protein